MTVRGDTGNLLGLQVTPQQHSIFTTTRSNYNLNDAHPKLLQQPFYKCAQSVQTNDTDNDSDSDIGVVPIVCSDIDYLLHDDDVMIDNEEENHYINTNDEIK